MAILHGLNGQPIPLHASIVVLHPYPSKWQAEAQWPCDDGRLAQVPLLADPSRAIIECYARAVRRWLAAAVTEGSV